MSDSVFKSSFVSIAEIKRTIPIVDENHHRILGLNEGQKEQVQEEIIEKGEVLSADLEESLAEVETPIYDDEEEKIIFADELAYDRIVGNEISIEDEPVAEEFESTKDGSDDNLPSMTLKLAKEEAELLIKDAKNRAFEMEREAHERGYRDGLKLGEEKYLEELEAERIRLREKEENMELELEAKLRSYEPKIAAIIGRLVTQLVGNSDDENMILFLVKLALAENTSKGKVVINVSDDDFEKVRVHFEDHAYKDDSIVIEIKKNDSLSKNDCLLETDFGVVDSSVSVRLDSFLKEINIIKESLG